MNTGSTLLRLSGAAMAIALASHAMTAQAPRRPAILLKGGHVIDARNGVNGIMDVAIADGKISAVGANLTAPADARVVDVRGLYLTPGLIDIHAHVFWGTDNTQYSNGPSSVPPDGHSFRAGQTTLVDAGGAGWRNFPLFKTQVIDRSRTRVLAFLNIAGHGMRGGPWEQDLGDMDAKLTAQRARQFRDQVVGVKVAPYEGPQWDPVTRPVEAGRQADIPVMIDFGGNEPPQSLDALLNTHLRPGDIFTHMYAHVRGRTPVVNAQGQVEPYVIAAQKRGVVFDVGHGGGSFLFRQAIPATRQGFWPDVISTDLHIGSMNSGMKDILNVMSKFLNLGMSLQDVVKANTARAAAVIKRTELGHLGVGAEADVAVLALRKGEYGFVDSSGWKMPGTQKLECELTIKGGQVVWDLNGRSHADWTEDTAR